MSLRFNAVQTATSRQPVSVSVPGEKVTDYFAESVFDLKKMQKYLEPDAFAAVLSVRENGGRIDKEVAGKIAQGMKVWAMEKGVTHYAHWFQPLTGTTAEKHDSFLDFNYSTGTPIEKFAGSLLVQQEPDASSFPSGGIRSTFEARGYTAWDPESPAFIIDTTLCIPSVFISYTGESLDYKTPLLKTNALLNKAATAVCKYFDEKITKVSPTLGWEQEFFLVDAALYEARPDLILTGRTVLGHSASKDQQLEDHYFGSIPERAAQFIREVEIESHRLGIPAKTRHNEVAPNQFEIAPIFENVDIAVDHNILLMDVMRRVAKRHNLVALLHEKPFAGINGSGKHNNWSMSSNTGINLLSPGKDKDSHLMFLTFLANVVKAVHTNSDLLLASIATPGNEHRLGGNEAPPAIFSAFLGSALTKMLNLIENTKGDGSSAQENSLLTIDIEHIPELTLDNTDRNRTSPFAFTGNKFEFRAVGSSANCAGPMMTLGAAVAEQLTAFKKDVDALISSGIEKEEALLTVIRKIVIESKNIRFDGNNYSDEWKAEAKARGLKNITSAPEAWAAFKTDRANKLYVDQNIYSHRELEARYEISLETYVKKMQIEIEVMDELISNVVTPVALKYQSLLVGNVVGLNAISLQSAAAPATAIITKISEHLNAIQAAKTELTATIATAEALTELEAKAVIYAGKVRSLLSTIRTESDELELIVDNELWPLPKYRELLFTK